jgi:hypothetical protein
VIHVGSIPSPIGEALMRFSVGLRTTEGELLDEIQEPPGLREVEKHFSVVTHEDEKVGLSA